MTNEKNYRILDEDSVLPSAPTTPAQRDKDDWARSALEKVALAAVTEQRSARLWRNGIRIAWLLVFIAVIVLLSTNHETADTGIGHSHTAVVKIYGEIASGAEASAEYVLPAIRKAFEDKDAQAVVLLINSPGGSPVQAGIINDEIYRLKELHKKPIYVVTEETCASAAYYIASAADRIFVDKASVVGSIGVLMEGFGFTGLMEKIGVERRLLIAGENKGFLDPFSQQDLKQRQFTLSMLDTVHQQFIAALKKGRGSRLKESPELFSGLFWTGQQAVDMGLADQLGSMDTVARDVIKAERVVDYSHKKNPLDTLVKRLGASIGDAAIRAILSGQKLGQITGFPTPK
jgi:protease-4